MVWLPPVSGWEERQAPSPEIRLALGDPKSGVSGVYSSAVVLVVDVTGEDMGQAPLDDVMDGLQSRLDEQGVALPDGFHPQRVRVCGLAAQQVSYPMAVNGVDLQATTVVALVSTEPHKYLVTLTVQSPTPDDPQHREDAEALLDRWRITAG